MNPRIVRPGRDLDPERLRRLGFFREFSPQELRRILLVGTQRRLRGGELLATEGTRKQRRVLYVVLQGELHYVKRIRGERANTLLTLRTGDVGGFLTFFNDDPSPVSVECRAPSVVFEIGRREFQSLLEERPPLAVKMLLVLLRDTVSRLDGLLGRVASTAAWALDLEHHLRALPMAPEG
ncbi:MAG TPA: cyclic nucleotide-binding domain-containing protein [Candidatus Methylomirabilis sp.]|nr:cyclic nucleotide-binding domain-containing protein [Candidatus Methylomirabilis sp.]